jgi:SAM-dependent methyltransferase
MIGGGPYPRAVRRLRFLLGRTYAACWRAADALVARAAPRSARAALRRPRLPAAPYHRKYGLRVGRPIDRVYIEGFLERHAGDVRGRVLEIYDRGYTERFGGEGVERSEVLDNSPTAAEATVSGDLETGAGLPAAAFDCFNCTQTLSLIYDVRAAVANAHALLKPGGVLLVTVPGISQQADPAAEEFPDYWRFTKLALERLLRERFEDVAVEAHGTVAAAGAFLYGVPADEVDPALLAPHDPDYELVVCARARRAV